MSKQEKNVSWIAERLACVAGEENVGLLKGEVLTSFGPVATYLSGPVATFRLKAADGYEYTVLVIDTQ